MTQQNLAKLEEVFRLALEVPKNTDLKSVEQGHQGWDSLGHVKLVAAIENTFGLEIDTGEALELTSFQKTREWLEQHGF